ncbi:MAG: hypothetical protein H0Z33_15440 [Bacillaceae bacterium]|nr:hypothetical protein [Bacillaceae bacterium]
MIRVKSNFNLVMFIILSSLLLIGFVVGMIKYYWSVEQHKEEIYRVIREKGGRVIEITKNEGPFEDKVGTANTVYEIEYKKDREVYKAWYRTTRGDIHVEIDNEYHYKDKWIWQEDEEK